MKKETRELVRALKITNGQRINSRANYWNRHSEGYKERKESKEGA